MMSLTRKLMMLVFTVALAAPVLGCMGGVGSSAADSRRTLARIIDYDTRMLLDDIALLTQTHRTLRTSRWVID